jgi:hypothetical protein
MNLSKLVVCAFLISMGPQGARAASIGKCVVSGPRYWLTSDAVDWSMSIGSGQSCVANIRFNNVVIENAKLTTPPQAGDVALQDPTFTYSAKPEFAGRDRFTVALTGSINKSRTKGSSFIRVSVFVVAVPRPVITSHDRTSVAVPNNPQSTAPTRAEPPLPDTGPLQPCPTWDWSKGAPPPMRRPFDRSKLYCPPKPFKPAGQPVGCTCP